MNLPNVKTAVTPSTPFPKLAPSSPRTPSAALSSGERKAGGAVAARRRPGVGPSCVAGRSPTSSPAPCPGPRPGASPTEPPTAGPGHAMATVSTTHTHVADRRAVVRRLLTVLLLVMCAVTALLAVPSLRPVVHELKSMNPVLVTTAVGLELASCLGFVIVFRLFFAELPKPAAREMAWTQMGSGAPLP